LYRLRGADVDNGRALLLHQFGEIRELDIDAGIFGGIEFWLVLSVGLRAGGQHQRQHERQQKCAYGTFW
jgi:hypothetical protein